MNKEITKSIQVLRVGEAFIHPDLKKVCMKIKSEQNNEFVYLGGSLLGTIGILPTYQEVPITLLHISQQIF